MKRLVAGGLLLLALAVGFGCPAVGDGGPRGSCTTVGSLDAVSSTCTTDATQGGGSTTAVSGVHVTHVEQTCVATGSTCFVPPCAVRNDNELGMSLTAYYSDGSTRTWCDYPSDGAAPAAPQITAGQVLTAMRRLGWPASELRIQPVKGRTLVNFRTNFYTTNAGPTTRRVRLLGQAITIEATPSYRWVFGDGSTKETSTPGGAYPALLVTHEYLRKGVVRPRLDTIYSGRYRLGNGPWQEIRGTVTVPGTPQRLEVVTASPVLVGYE